MDFIQHVNLKGLHAPFAASQSAWLRYDDDKAIERYSNRNRKLLGSELHEYARSQIMMRQKVTTIKNLITDVCTFVFAKYDAQDNLDFGLTIIKGIRLLPKEVFETVKIYINDAIGYGMTPEVVLYYSEKFFGTTDTISFRNNFLRIHDLKTGEHAVTMDQLVIYAVYFCLEYQIKPGELEGCELCIYQNGDIISHEPTVEELVSVMDKVIHFNKILIGVDEEV